jgi:hypothetical protein
MPEHKGHEVVPLKDAMKRTQVDVHRQTLSARIGPLRQFAQQVGQDKAAVEQSREEVNRKASEQFVRLVKVVEAARDSQIDYANNSCTCLCVCHLWAVFVHPCVYAFVCVHVCMSVACVRGIVC